MEIAEVIRRWQAGSGPQRIASGTGLSRNTVRKYVAAAKAMGITKEGPLPDEEHLSLLAAIGQSGPRQVHTPRQDALEPWADQIYQWITGDRLQMTRIHLRRPGPYEGRGGQVVSAGGRNAGPRHHPQKTSGGLPGRGAPCPAPLGRRTL